jgi:hypothetical protein
MKNKFRIQKDGNCYKVQINVLKYFWVTLSVCHTQGWAESVLYDLERALNQHYAK